MFVYICCLIVDVGTSLILWEAGVSIIPVVLKGRILFLWSSPVWSSIRICPSWLVAPYVIFVCLVVLSHLFLLSYSPDSVYNPLWICPTII